MAHTYWCYVYHAYDFLLVIEAMTGWSSDSWNWSSKITFTIAQSCTLTLKWDETNLKAQVRSILIFIIIYHSPWVIMHLGWLFTRHVLATTVPFSGGICFCVTYYTLQRCCLCSCCVSRHYPLSCFGYWILAPSGTTYSVGPNW